ncbi:MAG: MASE1 domain-containing protein [Xanthobacteraceae bacterium]
MLFRQQSKSIGWSWEWVSDVWLAAAVGCGYFLAARLSLGLLLKPDGVAVFWPAAGISSGILIVLGPRVRVPVSAAVIAATVAANLMGDRNISAGVGFALCNAIEALITAGIIHSYFKAGFTLGRLQEVLGLVVAAIAATVVSGIGGAISFKLFHSPDVPMFITWWHWFASDAIGIIAVAPLVIGIVAAARNPPPRRELIEGTTALVLLAAVTGVIILLPKSPWQTLVPGGVLFPMLLWVAARCRPVFAAAGAFIVSLTVVWATIFGIGHFGDPEFSLDELILQAQAVILVVTLGAFVLAALFAERKQHETVLMNSEARLARANKMLQRERDNKLMNVGAAISAISHELKQPLTAIVTKGSAARRFLERTPSDVPRVQSILSEIVEASFRANEVLENIHGLFSHDQEPHPTDINELVGDSLRLMHEQFERHRIKIVTQLASDMPAIAAHRGQLQEVIINLLQNSIDAMERIEPPRLLRIETERRGPNAVGISIRDSGKGIDARVIDSIFDAFVTTKAKGKGLGLAISRMIVERHDGQLTASSAGLENGTVFQIVLPVNAEQFRERLGSEP